MKKIVSLILVSLMMLAMSVPMFASFVAEEDLMEVAFTISKSDIDVKLDGDVGEFDMHEVETKASWMSYALGTDVEDHLAAMQAMEVPLYMAWDDTYIYIATTYKPANYSNTFASDPPTMWRAGAIQVNLASMDAGKEERLEYGNGLTSDTNEMISTVWAQAPGKTYVPDDNFFVKNDNGTLIYETRVAWTDFLEAAPKEGEQFKFCIIWAAGNGEEQGYEHKQLASGCSGGPGKDTAYFAVVTLGAAPDRPVEIIEEVEETTAPAAPTTTAPTTTTTAAQTNDSIIYVVMFAVIAFAGIVVTRKIKE